MQISCVIKSLTDRLMSMQKHILAKERSDNEEIKESSIKE